LNNLFFRESNSTLRAQSKKAIIPDLTYMACPFYGNPAPGTIPEREGNAVDLTLQILVLLIGAGGSVVTAFTLPESRAKWGVVSTFGMAGLVGLALTILTYEHLTFVDVGTWMWSYLQSTWSYLTSLIQRRWFQLIAVFLAALLLGHFGPRLYERYKIRKWYSSYDILELADQRLREISDAKRRELHDISVRILDLQKERKSYRAPFGSGPIAPESEGMAILGNAVMQANLQHSDLMREQTFIRENMLDDVYEKLKSGKLIARGFVAPAGSAATQVYIRREHWKIIKFNDSYTEAAGDYVRYVGIDVAKA
jgi:hypothetical protein